MESSRPWWDKPAHVDGVAPSEPGFDAVFRPQGPPASAPAPAPMPTRRTVLGGLPRTFEPPVQQVPAPSLPPSFPPSNPTAMTAAASPEVYVPVFAPETLTPEILEPEDLEPEQVEPASTQQAQLPVEHADPGADPASAPHTDREESPVSVGTDEGTVPDDVAPQPEGRPQDAADADAWADELNAAFHLQADDVPIPVAELGVGFGERIERLIAAAVTEAENTRSDAENEAAQLVQTAKLDAEHTVAAAQRQAAELVTSTQRRCDDELAAAQRARQEADQVLADARQEADQTRRRVRDEVTELRAEIDQHAQTMLARTHADTTRMLASARTELEEIAARKAELEAQMSSIRSLLSDALVAPVPQEVSGFLGKTAAEAPPAAAGASDALEPIEPDPSAPEPEREPAAETQKQHSEI